MKLYEISNLAPSSKVIIKSTDGRFDSVSSNALRGHSAFCKIRSFTGQLVVTVSSDVYDEIL